MTALFEVSLMTAVLSLLALAIAVAASWSLLQSGDPWRTWRRFAEGSDLAVIVPVPDGDPQMSGVWRGVKVRVVCAQSEGVTHFLARVPEVLPCALTVRPRRGVLEEAPEGAISAGDPDLDSRFIFRSGEPEALGALLDDAGVRLALAALSTHHPGALLEDGALRFTVAGKVLDPAGLEGALDDLVEPLLAMVRAAGGEEPAEVHIMAAPAAVVTDADGDRLARLSDPSLGEPERRLVLDELGGGLMFFTVVAERVGSTTALVLDEAYKDGRTLYAAAGSLQVAVRFPASRDADLDDVRAGETIRVRARVSGWDALTRRLILTAP